MTAEVWPAEQCPACLHAQSVALDAGGRLCLNCHHEWDPSTTTGPLASTPAPAPQLTIVEAAVVADMDPDEWLAATVADARARYVGTDVVLHSEGVVGTLAAIDDDGIATIEFGSGYSVTAGVDEFSAVDVPVVVDDQIAQVAIVDMHIAAQVLRAGAATIVDDAEGRRLGMGAEGWLPEDVGAILVIEHGASYAVALLAVTLGVPTEQILSMADMLDEAATAAKGATGQ